MALSPNITADSIKRVVTSISDETERYMGRWSHFHTRISTLTSADLDALGITDAAYKSSLAAFRTQLKTIIDHYALNSDTIKQFSDLTVF